MNEQSKVVFLKKVDLFKQQIQKFNANDVVMNLQVCLDVSGSMQDEYRAGGYMDELMKRFIALATLVDPDKKLEVIAFDHRVHELPDMYVQNFDNYLSIIRSDNSLWGSTAYHVALDYIRLNKLNPLQKIASLFGLVNRKKQPTFVCFFTDGSPDSARDARDALYQLKGTNTYVQFIGVGQRNNFQLIETLANELDYVGFVHFSTLSNVSDEEFIEKFLHQESIQWIKENM